MMISMLTQKENAELIEARIVIGLNAAYRDPRKCEHLQDLDDRSTTLKVLECKVYTFASQRRSLANEFKTHAREYAHCARSFEVLLVHSFYRSQYAFSCDRVFE